MRRFDAAAPGFDAAFADFLSEPRGEPAAVEAAVAEIIDAVAGRGFAAVAEFSARFDGVALSADDARMSPADIDTAAAACPPDVVQALEFAAERIRAYHQAQKPADHRWVDEAGVELGWRWRPLASVGIYVPGGRAAYPSSVLMNAIPAAVAGVARIAMATPPGRLGPAVAAAAKVAGVTEIWRLGGAQAIAALALGAAPLAPVDKIVGPGNAFVTAAKRTLFGRVGIDAVAGPSEVVIVAEAGAPATWIAADLIAQAEHDPEAQAILITDDRELAAAVESAVTDQLPALPTGQTAAAALGAHGAIVIAPAHETAKLVDLVAPEHLELMLADPDLLAEQIHHAGAIFLGPHAPEAIGDYVAGPNHVLPTARSARFSSGLSVADFMRRSSLIRCDEAAFRAIASAAATLAEAEGLPGHARSLGIRAGPVL
ncbi:MAG TPA: histidinol dehydrogenase [Caulobacteraceae bacterium]|nr:histidinol dehydrogenase [Caulobacteraceae bacterium]